MPPSVLGLQPVSLEERQKLAEGNLEQFKNAPVVGAPVVSPKYKAHRERVWRLWINFTTNVSPIEDPKEPWVGLCRQTPAAQAYFKAFIDDFVQSSRVWRPVLGSKEWEEVKTVTSVNTVLDFWKTAMQEGNDQVLQQQRDEDPENEDKWTLRWHKGYAKGRARGAVYNISQYISGELAEKFGLTREQTFEKVEATPDDIRILLITLWTRAADIDCSPDDRLSFNGILVLTESLPFPRVDIPQDLPRQATGDVSPATLWLSGNWHAITLDGSPDESFERDSRDSARELKGALDMLKDH